MVFRWTLIDIATVFLEPLIEILVFVTFLVVAISCFVHGVRGRRGRRLIGWRPFLICCVTASVAYFTPFDELNLKMNFHRYQSRRAVVAQQIIAGQTGTVRMKGMCGDFTTLSAMDAGFSDGGEVVVSRESGKPFVLFLTFRGILERFSGFAYSATDEPPAKTEFCGDGLEIERVAPHWFWYAS
jgi:hypothetical protein